MPNFRAVSLNNHDNESVQTNHHKLYRSSRPDFLTEEEVTSLVGDLGIKSIIDLRSLTEYQKSKSDKPVDHHFSLLKVSIPRRYNHADHVQHSSAPEQSGGKENSRRHFLINFFTTAFFMKLLRNQPWYMKVYAALCLFVDVLFRTGYKNFLRSLAVVFNEMGLAGQYVCMLELSQSSICSGLLTNMYP